ncbi:hypothetical protein EAF56_06615 [Vibrio alginolyticus]|nr:hypothetical protein [Vibrio alginolyticus]
MSKTNKEIVSIITNGLLSQALPIAIIPILARLYSPDDFGSYAIYFSMSAICSMAMTLRYDSAIYNAKSITQTVNLILVNFITIVSVIIILISVYVMFEFDREMTVYTLVYVLVSAAFQALFRVIQATILKKQNYKIYKKSLIVRSIFTSSLQLVFFEVQDGLILGSVAGFIISVLYMCSASCSITLLYKNFSFKKIKLTSVSFKSFPMYSFPAVMINTVVNNALPIIIASIYGVKEAGLYALTQRILGMPTALIGNTLAQYLMSKVSLAIHNKGFGLYKFTMKFIVFLSISAVTLFGLVLILPEFTYLWLFGEEWEGIKSILISIVGFYFMRFIASPVSVVVQVKAKNKIELSWQILYSFSIILVTYISYVMEFSMAHFLMFFSAVSVFLYMLLVIINVRESKKIN